MERSTIVAWLKKRKWDLVFYTVLALILFVPSIRMPVVSTVQRVFAFSPSELKETKQRTVRSFDWELEDLTGNPVHFSQSKGKVTLVNLWATWCPPCVAEMPSLQKLYDKYGNEVDFYFISDEDPNTVLHFMENKSYTFPAFLPNSQPPTDFSSQSLPTTYVLNKEGKIIIQEIGAHDWFSSKFQKRLDELIKE